jgi:hypothetical protein
MICKWMEKLTLNALCIMFHGLMDLVTSPCEIGGIDHPLRKPRLVRF